MPTARAASTTSSPSAARCDGANAKISWTQVETGSAITWKYPSVILKGDNSVGEFYSVALTKGYQQADTGTKMIHIGEEHPQHHRLQGHLRRSRPEHLSRPGEDPEGCGQRPQLLAVRFDADRRSVRRSHVPLHRRAEPVGKDGARGLDSKIGEDQIFYCNQRGIATEDAVSMIVNGFCKEVFRELPMEFAVEAQKLLAVNLEGSVG